MDIKEKTELKQKFNECYRELCKDIDKFEPTRKNYLNRHRKTIIVRLLASGLVTLFIVIRCPLVSNSNETSFGLIMLYFCAFSGLFVLYAYIFGYLVNNKDELNKKFCKIIKDEYFDKFLSAFDFIKKGHEDTYSVLLSGIVHNSDGSSKSKIIIDDAFHGTYKDVKFNITELSNGMIRGKKGVYSGPWNGIIIDLTFNKYTSSKIDIVPKSDNGYLILIIAGIIACISSGFIAIAEAFWAGIFLLIFGIFWTVLVIYGIVSTSFEKVNLEDIVFSKKYYVQAEDQIEARYILTPAFMEKLNNLKTFFKAKKVWCKFEGEQITMAFETRKDIFEIGNLYAPIKDTKQVEQFYNEMTAITNIIDHFKLNEKTGL